MGFFVWGRAASKLVSPSFILVHSCPFSTLSFPIERGETFRGPIGMIITLNPNVSLDGSRDAQTLTNLGFFGVRMVLGVEFRFWGVGFRVVQVPHKVWGSAQIL